MSVAAAFNQKQAFNSDGIMFLVMERRAGWCVVRVAGPERLAATMVVELIDDEAAAVAAAERLCREALT